MPYSTALACPRGILGDPTASCCVEHPALGLGPCPIRQAVPCIPKSPAAIMGGEACAWGHLLLSLSPSCNPGSAKEEISCIDKEQSCSLSTEVLEAVSSQIKSPGQRWRLGAGNKLLAAALGDSK